MRDLDVSIPKEKGLDEAFVEVNVDEDLKLQVAVYVLCAPVMFDV